MKKYYSSSKNGFSLIELSIVLIIIGLLIAGITSGSSLIRSAKISATISQWSDWEIAVNAYKIAKDTLPGDINDNGKIGYVQDGVAYAATGDVCTACGHYTGDYADKTIGTIAGPWVDLYLAKLSNFEPDPTSSALSSVWYPNQSNIDVIVPKSKLGKKVVTYFNFVGTIALCNGNVDADLDAKLFFDIDKKVDDGLWDSGVIKTQCNGYETMEDPTYDGFISSDAFCWNIDYYFKF